MWAPGLVLGWRDLPRALPQVQGRHVKGHGMIETTTSNLPVPSAAANQLQQLLRRAGWELAFIDLDLAQERPVAQIRVDRDDGRWVWARVDALGRCTIETFQRERVLAMSPSNTGRRPLSPEVSDHFLGRTRPAGARAMLRCLIDYLADNALQPVALADAHAAWAAVMVEPLRIGAPPRSSDEGEQRRHAPCATHDAARPGTGP